MIGKLLGPFGGKTGHKAEVLLSQVVGRVDL